MRGGDGSTVVVSDVLNSVVHGTRGATLTGELLACGQVKHRVSDHY